MINWVRFQTIELKEMTTDGNITDKMKCFLHAPRRNSLLLLRQSTRLRSNHKSHYNTALARNVQITWCSNRIMFCTISKFIALVWKQSCIQFQVLSNSLVGTSIRQPMSIQQCPFPQDSVREDEFQRVASRRTFSYTKGNQAQVEIFSNHQSPISNSRATSYSNYT